MFSNLINKKIQELNDDELENFLSKLVPVVMEANSVYQYKAVDKVKKMPIKKLLHHGCYMCQLEAYDSISIKRHNIGTSANIEIKKIVFNNDVYENIINKMVKQCIYTNDKVDLKKLEYLCEYFLYVVGDKKYDTLNADIPDSLLELWEEKFKPVYFQFKPSHILSDLAGFNYFGLGINFFINNSKSKIIKFLSEGQLHISKVQYLVMRTELTLYAPYILDYMKYIEVK